MRWDLNFNLKPPKRNIIASNYYKKRRETGDDSIGIGKKAETSTIGKSSSINFYFTCIFNQ